MSQSAWQLPAQALAAVGGLAGFGTAFGDIAPSSLLTSCHYIGTVMVDSTCTPTLWDDKFFRACVGGGIGLAAMGIIALIQASKSKQP